MEAEEKSPKEKKKNASCFPSLDLKKKKKTRPPPLLFFPSQTPCTHTKKKEKKSLLLRAAFHDAGTYNPNAPAGQSKGGINGSLRKELSWPSNAGIVAVWPVISTGHKILNAKFNNSFSWADSIAIAGAAGVEKAGGPAIAVGLGRPDAAAADPKVGLATDPLAGINLTGDEAVAAWAEFGQSPETLATLMGAHTIGRSALTPLQGPLGTPSFTNYFYKAVLEQKCSFAVDNALASQPLTAPVVQAYAADQVRETASTFFFLGKPSLDPPLLIVLSLSLSLYIFFPSRKAIAASQQALQNHLFFIL